MGIEIEAELGGDVERGGINGNGYGEKWMRKRRRRIRNGNFMVL